MFEIAGGIILGVVGLWVLGVLVALISFAAMLGGEKKPNPEREAMERRVHSDQCPWACRVLNHKW